MPKAPATLLLMACSFLRRSSARRFFSASSLRIRSFSASSFRFFSSSFLRNSSFSFFFFASSIATLSSISCVISSSLGVSTFGWGTGGGGVVVSSGDSWPVYLGSNVPAAALTLPKFTRIPPSSSGTTVLRTVKPRISRINR